MNFAAANVINQALYTKLAKARNPHVPGRFKEKYRLVNQVVQFNLNPRDTENKPSPDWAKYIFGKLIEFKANVLSQTRMSYPCLITKICKRHGVTGSKYVALEKLDLGILNSTTLMKVGLEILVRTNWGVYMLPKHSDHWEH